MNAPTLLPSPGLGQSYYPPGYENMGWSFGTGAGYAEPGALWRPGCYRGWGAPVYGGCTSCSGFVPVPDYYRRFC